LLHIIAHAWTCFSVTIKQVPWGGNVSQRSTIYFSAWY
jgi:hypothetical protein